MAKEFSAGKVGVLKANVAINEDGNIAQSGETAAANKALSLQGVKSGATLAEANTFYNEIYGKIGGASYDSDTMVKTVTYTVVDVQGE